MKNQQFNRIKFIFTIFMGLKGGPTQDEIMAVSLQKLDIKHGAIMADIGCGTAKISIAASGMCSRIYAIDRRPEAVEYAEKEIADSGTGNIVLIHDEALSALDGTGPLDCAFVGGSRDLEQVLEKLTTLVRGRIVVNAVLLETAFLAVQKMKELGIFREAVHMQVSRSHELAGGTMFVPVNPVYIIVGEAGN